MRKRAQSHASPRTIEEKYWIAKKWFAARWPNKPQMAEDFAAHCATIWLQPNRRGLSFDQCHAEFLREEYGTTGKKIRSANQLNEEATSAAEEPEQIEISGTLAQRLIIGLVLRRFTSREIAEIAQVDYTTIEGEIREAIKNTNNK